MSIFKTVPRSSERAGQLQVIILVVLSLAVIAVGSLSKVVDFAFGGGWTILFLMVSTITCMVLGALPQTTKLMERFMTWERKDNDTEQGQT